jgi:hypothetical protein
MWYRKLLAGYSKCMKDLVTHFVQRWSAVAANVLLRYTGRTEREA